MLQRDPKFKVLFRIADPIPRIIPDQRPLTDIAVRTIVAQLVSAAAARTISERLIAAHGSVEGVVDWAMTTPEDDPPAHSLSRAKRKAIAHWGRFLVEEGDPRPRWGELEAEELLSEIMKLRGFGRWSAEMLAIFGFGHRDIWPEGDAGVMRVARKLWPRRKPPSIRRLVAGHGTYAALCCWAAVDRGGEAEL